MSAEAVGPEQPQARPTRPELHVAPETLPPNSDSAFIYSFIERWLKPDESGKPPSGVALAERILSDTHVRIRQSDDTYPALHKLRSIITLADIDAAGLTAIRDREQAAAPGAITSIEDFLRKTRPDRAEEGVAERRQAATDLYELATALYTDGTVPETQRDAGGIVQLMRLLDPPPRSKPPAETSSA